MSPLQVEAVGARIVKKGKMNIITLVQQCILSGVLTAQIHRRESRLCTEAVLF